jgi:hypothetical protein
VILGKYYLIVDCPTGSHVVVYDAKLIDIVLYDELVMLFLETEMEERIFVIDLVNDNENFYSAWKLVDIDFFLDEIKEKQEKEFCADY